MQDQQVDRNLKGMDDLDFEGWNKADWNGVFADHHTSDVLVDWKGQEPTHGVQEHIDAMKAYVGEFEDGSRMVTVAKWRDGAIVEEYIWA
jgi:hypothetical protein